MILGWIY